jgi:hypothetical protein
MLDLQQPPAAERDQRERIVKHAKNCAKAA